MTTQPEAKAGEPTEDKVDQALNEVEAGQDIPEVEQPAPETAVPETPSYATVDDLRAEIGRLQGQFAQRTGQSAKDLGDRLGRLETMLSDMASQSYEDRLRQMDPEERETFLLGEVKRLRTPEPQPEQPAQPEQRPDPWGFSDTERMNLANRVQGMIDGMGVENVQHSDQRIWSGVRGGETYEELVEIARKNISGLRPRPQRPAAPPPNDNQPDPVAPTTQGAPAEPATSFDTLVELSQALKDGEITATQFRETGKERGWWR